MTTELFLATTAPYSAAFWPEGGLEPRMMYAWISLSAMRHCLGPNFTPVNSPTRRSRRTVGSENFNRLAVSATVKCSSIYVIVH